MILRLMKEKPRYGYEIMEKFEEISGGHWDPSYGTIYGALERLEDKGLISRTESEHEDRKYFEITEDGEEQLEAEKDKTEKHEQKSRKMSLGAINVYRHIHGEEKARDLIKKIQKESEKWSSESKKGDE